jgi:hypothetical protein
MSGWIKLHRKITDNPLYFSEQFNRSMAWIDLLLLANHTDNFFFKRGVRVDVKVGQVGYDLDSLAKRWKWSRGKVERFLLMLENDGQIARQKNNVTTLISIANYKEYQQDSKPNDKPNSKPNSKPNGNKQEGEERKEDKYSFLSSLIENGFDEQLSKEWMQVRKQLKAVNTETAFNSFMSEVKKHGGDRNKILRKCVERSWKGFNHTWLEKENDTLLNALNGIR